MVRNKVTAKGCSNQGMLAWDNSPRAWSLVIHPTVLLWSALAAQMHFLQSKRIIERLGLEETVKIMPSTRSGCPEEPTNLSRESQNQSRKTTWSDSSQILFVTYLHSSCHFPLLLGALQCALTGSGSLPGCRSSGLGGWGGTLRWSWSKLCLPLGSASAPSHTRPGTIRNGKSQGFQSTALGPEKDLKAQEKHKE